MNAKNDMLNKLKESEEELMLELEELADEDGGKAFEEKVLSEMKS